MNSQDIPGPMRRNVVFLLSAVPIAAAYTAVLQSDSVKIYYTTTKAAELCKYMENAFLATKVAFVNQFFDIAEVLGVDFTELRRLWLADPRIGESHSSVTAERGFRRRCLPKDLLAIISAMNEHGGAPLLESVAAYNELVCKREADRGKANRRLLTS